MKKSILMITLVMVFGLLCSTSLWAGNGKGAGDGSMLDVALTSPTVFTGTVVDAGTAGSGLSIDDGDEITVIYGMGPLGYWNSLGVLKPAISDDVSIAAVLVSFSDGDRWIAVSLTVGDDIVILRTEDGPAWRGQGGGTSCGGTGNCDGTGTCTQVTE
ncbi:MAG: hypothetical protein U9Q58_11610 [Pseudomonadota bacterium]|nr:hypothetical protein [Pseudomonadota bacterium]